LAGQVSIAAFLSATNTPFPWAKVRPRDGGTTKAYVWEPPEHGLL